MKRIFQSLAVLILVGYGFILGYFRYSESSLLYRPVTTGDSVQLPPAELGLPIQRVSFPTSDSIILAGWIIPAAAAGPAGAWILHLHGNTGDVGYAGRPKYYSRVRELGVNQLTFDYRGFGESTGEPSEEGLYRDAHTAYDYLREVLRVPADRIIIYGHSLGSAVAIELASQVPAAGLIAEGAMTSVAGRAQEVYRWIPIRLVARSRFDSIDRIQQVRIPKLFMHATGDRTIPIEHGRRLFARAGEPKEFVELGGGHDDAYDEDTEVYFREMGEFIRSVAPPVHADGHLTGEGRSAGGRAEL